jgi:hypothetical protein
MQVCSGSMRLNVYKNPTCRGGAVDNPVHFLAVSCWVDDAANRALSAAQIATGDTILEICAEICKDCGCRRRVLDGVLLRPWDRPVAGDAADADCSSVWGP